MPKVTDREKEAREANKEAMQKSNFFADYFKGTSALSKVALSKIVDDIEMTGRNFAALTVGQFGDYEQASKSFGAGLGNAIRNYAALSQGTSLEDMPKEVGFDTNIPTTEEATALMQGDLTHRSAVPAALAAPLPNEALYAAKGVLGGGKALLAGSVIGFTGKRRFHFR